MTKGKSKAKSVAKKAVIGVLTAVLAALTALVVYIMVCNSQGRAASLFGTSVLKVVSGSMEPSIHEGDYIIVRKTDISKLREDDIICFYSNDSAIYGLPNTHRIVKVLDNAHILSSNYCTGLFEHPKFFASSSIRPTPLLFCCCRYTAQTFEVPVLLF